MEFYKFVLTVISAEELHNVRRSGLPMEVYAVVSLSLPTKKGKQDPRMKKSSPPDKNNDVNPAWHFPTEYYIGVQGVEKFGLNLVIKLKCKRPLLHRNRYIGEVSVPIKTLFGGGDNGLERKPVCRGSAPSIGHVNFMYRFEGPMKKPKTPFWKKYSGLGWFVGKTLIQIGIHSTTGVPVYC